VALQRTSQPFKDISLSMKRHPVTKDIVMLKNEDAIKRSLQNLVRTQLGERFFDSTIGTRITGALFELANDDYIEPIQTEIEMVVKNYEPRVKLNDVVVENYPDQNALDISIRYDIIGLAAPSQSIKFVLEPTRL
tara:strand:- start:28756 stop:29160 length:405 start_codon:yes stop_codon:yes gene_type:complete